MNWIITLTLRWGRWFLVTRLRWAVTRDPWLPLTTSTSSVQDWQPLRPAYLYMTGNWGWIYQDFFDPYCTVFFCFSAVLANLSATGIVYEPFRVLLANRMAKNSAEWQDIFKRYNRCSIIWFYHSNLRAMLSKWTKRRLMREFCF